RRAGHQLQQRELVAHRVVADLETVSLDQPAEPVPCLPVRKGPCLTVHSTARRGTIRAHRAEVVQERAGVVVGNSGMLRGSDSHDGTPKGSGFSEGTPLTTPASGASILSNENSPPTIVARTSSAEMSAA